MCGAVEMDRDEVELQGFRISLLNIVCGKVCIRKVVRLWCNAPIILTQNDVMNRVLFVFDKPNNTQYVQKVSGICSYESLRWKSFTIYYRAFHSLFELKLF